MTKMFSLFQGWKPGLEGFTSLKQGRNRTNHSVQERPWETGQLYNATGYPVKTQSITTGTVSQQWRWDHLGKLALCRPLMKGAGGANSLSGGQPQRKRYEAGESTPLAQTPYLTMLTTLRLFSSLHFQIHREYAAYTLSKPAPKETSAGASPERPVGQWILPHTLDTPTRTGVWPG